MNFLVIVGANKQKQSTEVLLDKNTPLLCRDLLNVNINCFDICSHLPCIIKSFSSFNIWDLEGGCRDIYWCWRADVMTPGTFFTKAAHVLHQATPPVTFADLAKCRVNTIVWDTSRSCWRTTRSRARYIRVCRSHYMLLFVMIINDKLPLVLPATVIKLLHTWFI